MLISLALNPILLSSPHPMVSTFLIVTQVLIICLILWLSLPTSWLSFSLLLIFLGGMMVLFMYICSLASNEIISTSKKMLLSKACLMALLTLVMYGWNEFLGLSISSHISKMLDKVFSALLIISMVYLLVCLISVVKMMMVSEGGLRSSKH